MELPGSPKIERTCPQWDVPRQNRIIEEVEAQGWCLTNVSDRWLHYGKARVMTFRKAA